MTVSKSPADATGQRDPLLRVVRLIITALMGLCIVAVATSLVTIPIAFANKAGLVEALADMGIGATAFPSIIVLLLLVGAMTALGFLFLRHLRRIVASVSHGDPFVPVNADRLRHMAWLALAMQAMMIPLMGLVVWFDALPQQANVHYSDNNSFGGLLLALLLFVLARVFRVGTQMRDELEGTV
jgi:hypothetical protein